MRAVFLSVDEQGNDLRRAIRGGVPTIPIPITDPEKAGPLGSPEIATQTTLAIHAAGRDLTDELDRAPHGAHLLMRFSIAGVLGRSV